MRALACIGAAALSCAAASAAGSRQEADLLVRAGHARYLVAVHRARSGNSSAGRDLRIAIGALEEALAIDSTNMTALGYLGLARLEAARRAGADRLDAKEFQAARKPLQELFRLTRGWADPSTREVLKEVARCVREIAATDPEVRTWWESWRPRLASALDAPSASSGPDDLVRSLRSSPRAIEREDAVHELARSTRGMTTIASELVRALVYDDAVRVRLAAMRALARLHPQGWDARVADALRHDPSPWMRRDAATLLADAASSDRAPPGGRARAALVAALADDTPLVAAASARALGAIDGAQAALAEGVRSTSSLVRDASAWALRDADKDAAVVASLASLFADERAGVRGAAATALGPAGVVVLEAGARDALSRLLADAEPTVRAAAASTFGALGAQATDRLAPLLQDADPRVRLSSARALVRSAVAREDARRTLSALVSSRAPVRSGGDGSLKTVGEIASAILGGAVE